MLPNVKKPEKIPGIINAECPLMDEAVDPEFTVSNPVPPGPGDTGEALDPVGQILADLSKHHLRDLATHRNRDRREIDLELADDRTLGVDREIIDSVDLVRDLHDRTRDVFDVVVEMEAHIGNAFFRRAPNLLNLVDVVDGIASITMDSQHNRNALSEQLIRELHTCLDEAEDLSARAVVLGHEGPAFCAGADLKERSDGPPDATPFVSVLERLMDTERPTIAAVDGDPRNIHVATPQDLAIAAMLSTAD